MRTPLVMLKIFSNRFNYPRMPRDSESQDTLLPASPASLPIKHNASDRSRHDVRIAARTHVLCTIAYLCATLWMTFRISGTTPVADADEFCIHHVSEFCKCRERKADAVADVNSSCCQRREAQLAHTHVQRKLCARDHLSASSRSRSRRSMGCAWYKL